MAEIITIAAAREWMRLEEDDASDELIGEMLASATRRVFDYLGRPLEGEGSWQSDEVPSSVVVAVKTVAASLFDNRGVSVLTDADLRKMLPGQIRISFA